MPSLLTQIYNLNWNYYSNIALECNILIIIYKLCVIMSADWWLLLNVIKYGVGAAYACYSDNKANVSSISVKIASLNWAWQYK